MDSNTHRTALTSSAISKSASGKTTTFQTCADMLETYQLQAIDIPTDTTPNGFRWGATVVDLDFAIYSEPLEHCFQLPSVSLRPTVLAALKNMAPSERNYSNARERAWNPGKGIAKGDAIFWMEGLAENLQCLLKKGLPNNLLDAIVGPTIDLLPDDWFEERDWKPRLAEKLCQILAKPSSRL